MKKAICALALALIGMMVISPSASYAVSAHEWFLFGSEDPTNITGQNSAKTSITLVVPQSFTNSGEVHNWHVQIKDSGSYWHNVGYEVKDSATSTPKFFDEELFGTIGQHQVHFFETMGSIGNNGDVKDFAMWRSANVWNYYIGTSFEDQGSTNEGTTFSTVDLYSIAEKICPTSPYCTKDQGGAMPSDKMTNAMLYASSISFPPASWTAPSSAVSWYEYINNGGSPITGSTAQSEMCQPMSMKGHTQDGTLSNNQLVTGNNVVATCTTAGNSVWP